MTAAELLRRLAREPITTFDADTLDRLLPLLAGLVEAVGDVVASLDALSKAEPHQKLEAAKVSVGAHEVLRQRLDALNAAAAKEVGK